MIGLLQRVTQAKVEIENNAIGKIDQGLMVLVGVERTDNELKAEKLIDRLIHYRVFTDQNGKMNENLQQIEGGLLLVPQFTLTADTKKGTRPGFSNGAPPDLAEKLFLHCVKYAKTRLPIVESGKFGADMLVSLSNDGPVTITLTT